MFGHQDSVRTVEGHKLPFLLNYLPAYDLSRGTARIHEEKLPIRFWHVSKNRHRQFPSREMDSLRMAVAQPLYQAAAHFGLWQIRVCEILCQVGSEKSGGGKIRNREEKANRVGRSAKPTKPTRFCVQFGQQAGTC